MYLIWIVEEEGTRDLVSPFINHLLLSGVLFKGTGYIQAEALMKCQMWHMSKFLNDNNSGMTRRYFVFAMLVIWRKEAAVAAVAVLEICCFHAAILRTSWEAPKEAVGGTGEAAHHWILFFQRHVILVRQSWQLVIDPTTLLQSCT